MSDFKTLLYAVSLVGAVFTAGAAQAATDTIEAPTGFFVPTAAQNYDTPYYRNANQDWGWSHNAIVGPISSATLNISAFDVDFSSGEIDNIYAFDNGVKTLLGSLGGGSDIFSFTTFTLGSNFYDDIATGLQVFLDIDAANTGWVVTLSKSALITNGGTLPPATPGAVPEPTTWMTMLAGFGLVGMGMRRRKQMALSHA